MIYVFGKCVRNFLLKWDKYGYNIYVSFYNFGIVHQFCCCASLVFCPGLLFAEKLYQSLMSGHYNMVYLCLYQIAEHIIFNVDK